MQSNFDSLIIDFEKYKHCQVTFFEHQSDCVKTHQISYGTFRPKIDNSGRIHFPMDNSGYGYFITDEFDILKTDTLPSEKREIYRIEKEGIQFIGIYLYGLK
ncbi:MAG: hypothetical protein APF84_04285 [Gracilibacter sp. BRH_c7a]|nr:MAG: hypothetical protein APF84_04285 [Gracilibacter sp. BRH_c7a]